MNNDASLFSRYLSKFVNRFIGMLINAITVFIVPRTLGPSNYGDFNFLRDSFRRITSTLDLNIGQAHFNYSSKYSESKNATMLYFFFCLSLGIVLFLIIAFLNWCGLLEYLWPDQKLHYIYAGGILAYLLYLTERLTGLSDSKEATVGLEIRRLAVSIFGFGALLSIFFLDALNLASYFGLRICLNLFFICAFIIYLRHRNTFDFHFAKVELKESKKILRYFFSYSHPLVVLSLFSLLFGFFDRWFLQTIGGSVSQGYFSLAFQLSSICFLFTGAMTPVFMQSVAKAHGQENIDYIRTLFEKVRTFYFIAAFFSVFFFSIQARSYTLSEVRNTQGPMCL